MNLLKEVNYFYLMIKSIENQINDIVPKKEIEILKSIFYAIKLTKGQFFLREGAISNKLAFTISGALRCFYIDKNDNDITKYFCLVISILFSSSVLTGNESVYYIEALEDCI